MNTIRIGVTNIASITLFPQKFQSTLISLFLFLSLGVYFSFALFELNDFETADEHYWISDPQPPRIAQYWTALKTGHWTTTRINDKPGITLALVSGFAYLFGANTDNSHAQLFEQHDSYRVSHPDQYRHLFFLFRLPIVVFNAFVVLTVFFLLRRLIKNGWIALWSFLFILLSPTLLGISRIVNPDALLWSLTILAILAFALFLSEENWHLGLLAGTAFGLALLAKYTATILHPFFLFLLLLFITEKAAVTPREVFPHVIRHMVTQYFFVIISSAFLFVFLMPASLVAPKLFFSGIMGFWGMQILVMIVFVCALTLFILTFLPNPSFLHTCFSALPRLSRSFIPLLALVGIGITLCVFSNWLGVYVFDDSIRRVPLDAERSTLFKTKSFFEQTLLEWVPIFFTLTPLTFFSVIASWCRFTLFDRLTFIAFTCSSFLVLFVSGVLGIGLLAGVRYSIIVFPVLSILAGIGLFTFFSLPYLRRIPKEFITLGLLLSSTLNLGSVAPYYFSYAAPYFPKTSLINDAWGVGGAAAANYLNTLPNAKEIIVWTDYNGFCSFFIGRCIKGSHDWQQNANSPTGLQVDYFVKTHRGSVLYNDIWKSLYKQSFVTPDQKPLWTMNIANAPKNSIAIYKRQDSSIPTSTTNTNDPSSLEGELLRDSKE